MTGRCPQPGGIANVERQKMTFINHETFICYCELALFVPHTATGGTLLVYYTDYFKDMRLLFFNTERQMIFQYCFNVSRRVECAFDGKMPHIKQPATRLADRIVI
ncbi:hypothetical protein EAD81_07760 [Salmonella enterica]|nr:hypothetical protein [Salmonella enterica]